MPPKRVRCGKCPPCMSPNCGVCYNCQIPNRRQCCVDRKCENMQLKRQTTGQHMCHVCNKSYKTQRGIDNHMKKEHDPSRKDENNNCEHCGKTFKRLSSLMSHRRTQHVEHIKWDWKCLKCNRGFATQRGGRVHYSRMHLPKGVKEYRATEIVPWNTKDTGKHNSTDSAVNEVEDDTEIQWTDAQKLNLVKTTCARIFTAGSYESGKTSLTRTILKNKATTAHIDDRTVVVNFNSWQIDDNNSVPIFDLGGHHCYTYVAPFFHSSEASNIGLITHDMTRKKDEDYYCTYQWIRDVLLSSPKCQPLVILTKADCVRDTIRIKNIFCKKMGEYIQREIEMITVQSTNKEESSTLLRALEDFKNNLQNGNNVYMISCKTDNDPGCQKLIGDIKEKCLKSRVKMPQRYHLFYQSIGKIGVGRDCEQNADLQDNASCPYKSYGDADSQEFATQSSIDETLVSNDEDEKTKKMQYAEYDELFDAFNEIDLADDFSGLSHEDKQRQFDQCLRTLNSLGLIKWFEYDRAKDIIFNDLFTFIIMLKSIFNHKIEETFKFPNLHRLQKMIYNEREDIFDEDVKNVKCYGIMSIKLLQVLLCQDIEGLDERVDSVAEILVKMQMAFKLTSDCLFFPWFSTLREGPREHLSDIEQFSKQGNLIYRVKFLGSISETFYHSLCVKVFEHIRFSSDRKREMWKNGVFALMGNHHMLMKYKFKEGIVLEFMLHIDDKAEIRENIKSLREIWKCIEVVNKEIDKLTKTICSSLITKKILECAHCILTRPKRKCAVFTLENQLKEIEVDSKYYCNGENLPTAFIFPLPKSGTLHMVDLLKYLDEYQQKIGKPKHQQEPETQPHQLALRRVRHNLAESLKFKEIHSKLKTMNILIRRESESLVCTFEKYGELEAAEALIDIFIKSKATDDFEGLLKALKETHSRSIYSVLWKTYQEELGAVNKMTKGKLPKAKTPPGKHGNKAKMPNQETTTKNSQGRPQSTERRSTFTGQTTQNAVFVRDITQFPKVNNPRPKLVRNMEIYGLEMRYNPPGDGNCFFESVCDQLRFNNLMDISALDLRQDVVEYMQLLKQDKIDHYANYVDDDSWEAYLGRMEKNHCWAEHVVIMNCAEMLDVTIFILSSSEENPLLEIRCPEKPTSKGTLLLGHYSEVHYISLFNPAKAAMESHLNINGQKHEQMEESGQGQKSSRKNKSKQIVEAISTGTTATRNKAIKRSTSHKSNPPHPTPPKRGKNTNTSVHEAGFVKLTNTVYLDKGDKESQCVVLKEMTHQDPSKCQIVFSNKIWKTFVEKVIPEIDKRIEAEVFVNIEFARQYTAIAEFGKVNAVEIKKHTEESAKVMIKLSQWKQFKSNCKTYYYE